MSIGDLARNIKVNLHELEDQEREILLAYVQWSALEYVILTNQNIQLDPILTYLRLLARLQQWGSPNFGEIINTINTLKTSAKIRQLPAATLYLLIRNTVMPNGHDQLTGHIKSFFNMLMENNILNYQIGPPFSLESGLEDEKKVWNNQADLQQDIHTHMTVANLRANEPQPHLNGIPSNMRIKIKFTAGN